MPLLAAAALACKLLMISRSFPTIKFMTSYEKRHFCLVNSPFFHVINCISALCMHHHYQHQSSKNMLLKRHLTFFFGYFTNHANLQRHQTLKKSIIYKDDLAVFCLHHLCTAMQFFFVQGSKIFYVVIAIGV